MSHPLELLYSEVYHTHIERLGSMVHIDIGRNNTASGGPIPSYETFELVQFHFHAPSEHKINGVGYPAEVHLVHQSTTSNDTVVIAAFFQIGALNPWLDIIFGALSMPNGSNATLDINPIQLFPTSVSTDPTHLKGVNYYTYTGSMTTPPCTEGYTWIIFTDPAYASQDQITQLMEVEGLNNRPVQNWTGTVYTPSFTTPTQTAEEEDITHMGLVIGVSFLASLATFLAIVGIAIFALHLRDASSSSDRYGITQFELENTIRSQPEEDKIGALRSASSVVLQNNTTSENTNHNYDDATMVQLESFSSTAEPTNSQHRSISD